jgi:hypothetical protein
VLSFQSPSAQLPSNVSRVTFQTIPHHWTPFNLLNTGGPPCAQAGHPLHFPITRRGRYFTPKSSLCPATSRTLGGD